VVIVVNMANRNLNHYKIGVPRQGVWKTRFNSDWAGYDSAFGDLGSTHVESSDVGMDGMPCGAEIEMGPYSALILSQDD
jgi:1,4-alpha-glucan branching enzyme